MVALSHLVSSMLMVVASLGTSEHGVDTTVDVVSAASEPPELFVEIISPASGDTVEAGSLVHAFGGPGWAIPSLEFYIDDTLTVSSEDYNSQFETSPSLAEGEHTFRVQFTCLLDSCAGQVASASITVNIVGAGEVPGEPTPEDPSEPDPDPDRPTPEDPNKPNQFSGSGCSVSPHSDTAMCFTLFALLGFLVPRKRRPNTE